MRRVTGIGGLFFKTEDQKKITAWYAKHLELDIQSWGGCAFQWKDLKDPDAKVPASTVWSTFKADSDYFEPSKKPFMFNYRVENLVELLKVLKEEGVTVVGEIQEFPYGKFGWIMDPEGNKIELWEPKDDGF